MKMQLNHQIFIMHSIENINFPIRVKCAVIQETVDKGPFARTQMCDLNQLKSAAARSVSVCVDVDGILYQMTFFNSTLCIEYVYCRSRTSSFLTCIEMCCKVHRVNETPEPRGLILHGKCINGICI